MSGCYLVIIHGDVEPELKWHVDEESRDAEAIQYKREHGDEDGIFKLDFESDGEEDHPVMTSYSNGFFSDGENEYDNTDEYMCAHLVKCPKSDVK